MNGIRIFLIFVVFVFFSVVPVFSSTGGSAPKLEFTKWQAGQGQEYTVSNPPHTFITDTETTCEITATVAYTSNQPSSVYPLTGYTWQVTGSHGYTFTTQTEASGPVGQTGTTFKLTATGTGDKHNSSSGGHRPMRGRDEKPIKFTVKFIGEYGTDPNNQQEISIPVDFEQDKKDQIRQEYLDVRRLHEEHRSAKDNNTYGDLRVPSRGELGKSGQRFNDGHYSYLINKNLENKILHWWQACDKVAYEDLNNDDLKNDKGNKELRLTDGYRNPHHHVYHVYAGEPMSEIKYWSLHQFGLALDVGAMDMDGKNGITTAVDRYEMAEAAKDHAGANWTKHNYSDGHVHAQWGAVRNAPGGTSTSSQRSTQTSTTNTENPVTTPPETVLTTVTGACGVHTIASSESGDHVWGTAPCGDDTHVGYLCQIAASDHEWVYESCPSSHAHYECDGSDHSLQAICPSTDSNGNSCTVTSFYACAGHSHSYPPLLVECGHSSCSELVSSRTLHRATCGSGSHTYWPGCPNNPSGWDQDSAHALKTCGRSACRQTWRSCQSSRPMCLANSRKKCVAR